MLRQCLVCYQGDARILTRKRARPSVYHNEIRKELLERAEEELKKIFSPREIVDLCLRQMEYTEFSSAAAKELVARLPANAEERDRVIQDLVQNAVRATGDDNPASSAEHCALGFARSTNRRVEYDCV